MSEPGKNPSLLGEMLLKEIRQAVRAEIEAVMGQNGLAGKKPHDVVKPYLTVKEAAVFSRLAPSTIRLYIRKRKLKALKVGRRVLIARADLERFLNLSPLEVFPN